ncbi:MAG: tyrosine-type recombinase/integrase [Chloroflexales bacterium]|nr:tyrosine-type recombinase/integrase [Chloroflexales bacterium]
METAIAAWEQHLLRSSKLSANTITEYIQDIRRFAAWLRDQECTATVDDLTVGDAKAYRDALLGCGRSPATINRALTSLALFCDAAGRLADNPFRIVDRIDRVEHAPQALNHRAWNAVRRAAEQASRRDHGLTLALVCLMRFAGLRVGEVAALEGSDLLLSPRRGTVIVRRGKGLKHREIPLISDARAPLLRYQDHRRQLAERWAARALLRHQTPPAWSEWPQGRVFLGQRGPLTERGIRDIVAKIGMAAKLDAPLSPRDLRHTFATALLDPAAYGIDRPALPLTAVQDLLGHADPATTAIYTKAAPSDLARMLGEAAD